ncbi:hypothetical protein D9613_011855 [Agrocybe pediades]|uniref:F-box domain-containing protein n=1 Tax=Agrocybe pediades TaxID=84607 RepID=A0A8H4QKF0_9AGAR|nr:hypothetical protein D9613_011855 [Agrocybe pediades]
MQNTNDCQLSRTTKRCAVDALPPELLLVIFLNNTELVDNWDDHRLTTARYTSQVSRKWRSLILASASIWGRLLNIRKIGQATDEWREELRSRVGDAMLWITGEMLHTCSRPFLTTLLKEKWANVQIFDIVIYQLDPLVEIWPILQSKAPNLEFFAVEAYSSPTLPVIPPIFDDVAPRLRHFQGRPMQSVIPFSPAAPWLTNLRSISFSRTHTVYFIFSVLKSAPLLEMVVIIGSKYLPAEAVTTGEAANALSILLPRLKRLRIHQRHFTEVFSLLKHIKAPPCSLVVTWMRGLETGRSPDIEKTNAVSVEWVSAFVNDHQAKSIILELPEDASRYPLGSSNAHFLSIAVGMPEDSRQIPSFAAEIYIDHSSGYSALRELATCPGLSSVQRLTLVRMPPAAGKELVSLYQAFSSVTELVIDRCCHDNIQAFQLYDSLGSQHRVSIFPLLQTVQVRGCNNFSMFVGSLLDFLEYRARVGSPVLLLDLGEDFDEGFTEDQKIRLRQIDGLVVSKPRNVC